MASFRPVLKPRRKSLAAPEFGKSVAVPLLELSEPSHRFAHFDCKSIKGTE
jgi:hypothetical protein